MSYPLSGAGRPADHGEVVAWTAAELAQDVSGALSVTAVFRAHHAELVRLAVLLLGDRPSDYLIAISTSTGARTVWRNEAGAPHRWFSVDSLSWTSDDRELVVLGEWCPTATSSESCGSGRVAEVRALDPASGGGAVYSGRLLLRQSARFPYPVQALISPDGATITAVVLRGRVVGNTQISGSVPEDLSVQRFSVAAGQPLAVLYRHRLGDTSEVNGAPHFLALAQAASGRHLMLDIGLCAGHCTDGANGWIRDGRLVPLPPADGREADQAW